MQENRFRERDVGLCPCFPLLLPKEAHNPPWLSFSVCFYGWYKSAMSLSWYFNHGMDEIGRSHWQSSCPASLLKQGPLDHVYWGLCPDDFEYLHGRRLHDLSWQPVPVLGHLHSEAFPHVQVEPPVHQVLPTASCAITWHYWDEPGSVLLSPSRQVLTDIVEFPSQLFLLKAEQALFS